MIAWPDDDNDGAQKALSLFKKTSFAAELAEDSRTWEFRSWARSPLPPARMILRSEAGDETHSFTLEQTGFWRRTDD
jgi:hypothetical protein